jgi:hypothetical protein
MNRFFSAAILCLSLAGCISAAQHQQDVAGGDEERREVWVYDRIATEYVHSDSGVGLISLVGVASGSVAGGALPSVNQKSGASRRSQRSLTIIVRFDAEQRVRDYSYHASRF